MIDGVIIVSKKRAKEMIDEAPGDYVVLSRANFPSVKITKDKGKIYLEKTKDKIKYSDNDIFGILSLEDDLNESIIQNILFAQRNTV